jgi:hypothetical protein
MEGVEKDYHKLMSYPTRTVMCCEIQFMQIFCSIRGHWYELTVRLFYLLSS